MSHQQQLEEQDYCPNETLPQLASSSDGRHPDTLLQNNEGLFMYSTLRLKGESRERITSLQNRVNYLGRQEQSIRRSYNIQRSQNRHLRGKLSDYNRDKFLYSLKREDFRQQQQFQFDRVAEQRRYEKERQDPRERLRLSREVFVQKKKEESALLKAEAQFKQDMSIAKVKDRIAKMRSRELPADKRLRQSVLNKTQYLVRISQEQQSIQ